MKMILCIQRKKAERAAVVGQASSLSRQPMGQDFIHIDQPHDFARQVMGMQRSWGDRLEACPTMGTSVSARSFTPSLQLQPLLALVLLFATAGFSSAAGTTNGAAVVPSTRGEFVAFKVVSERNIFNPHRSKRAGDRPPPRTEPEKRVTMDRFALLGTMSYEKGRYAFFDGSSSDFRKVAKPDDSIAGFKIAEVAPTCVKLMLTNGTLLELCVGMQMKRSEDADWQLAGKADSASGSSGSSSSGSSSSSGTSTPESDDVLKRLLQRREQDGASTAVAPVEAAKPEEPKAAAAPGEADEVLRKLLQKREQEQNK